MKSKDDFTRYQEIQEQMRVMIRNGQYNYLTFNDAWTELEAIKAKHGGFPPPPDDYEAQEQEACEMANMKGLR